MTMFGNLLRNKVEVEEKVRKLQNSYIDAIKLRKFENFADGEEIVSSFSQEKANAEKLIREKQKIVAVINKEYKNTVQSHRELEKLIEEQKQIVGEIHKILKSTLNSLNIDIPAEFEEIESEKAVTQIQNQLDDIRLIDQNNRDESEDSKNTNESDKENSLEGYFSPQIKIRKSFNQDEAEKSSSSYTPAIKSKQQIN